MFRKLFSQDKTPSLKSHDRTGKHSKNGKPSQTSGVSSLEHEDARAQAMEKTEVREQKLDFPSVNVSLVDRLESHQKGNLFKYAVISTAPPKNRSAILDRLRTYDPPNDHANVRIDDLPAVLLSEEYTCINLRQALGKKHPGMSKPFCMVSDIFIHYVPLDTFLASQSSVQILLTDHRKLEDNVARQAVISSNTGYNILFTLDYCVETKNIDDLRLSFSRHVSKFKKGTSWAMCKILIGLDFFDFAKRANVQDTLAVTLFAESDLQEFLTDPRGTDNVVSAEGLRQLRNLYKSGDIENLTQARNDRRTLGTAATILGEGVPTGSLPAGDVITAMKLKALENQEKVNEAARQFRESEGLSSLKSSLKKSQSKHEDQKPEVEDRGRFDELDEIDMDEDPAEVTADGDKGNVAERRVPFVSNLQNHKSTRFELVE